MKWYIFSCLILLFSCQAIKKWQTEYPDNAVEEYVEQFIEEAIQKATDEYIDIDLTPFTGEELQKIINEEEKYDE